MPHHITRTSALLLLVVLLIPLLAGCGAPPPLTSPAPTPIPSLIPVARPTATSEPPPFAGQAQGNRGPTRRPAVDTTLATFTTEDFSGSGLCAACHVGLKDQAGADVSMPTHWRSTMMANAAKDPIWQAKVSSEVARFPALQAVIEKKCTT